MPALAERKLLRVYDYLALHSHQWPAAVHAAALLSVWECYLALAERRYRRQTRRLTLRAEVRRLARRVTA